MRVLTRYKYVQLRVYRRFRRNRGTCFIFLSATLFFLLFGVISEILNTSDRYRTFSMVSYSDNMSVQQLQRRQDQPDRMAKPVDKGLPELRNGSSIDKKISNINISQNRIENTTFNGNSKISAVTMAKNLTFSKKIPGSNSSKSDNYKPSSLKLLPSSNGSDVSKSSKLKYLSYKSNFSYPLHINLTSLVNDAMFGKVTSRYKPINPHNFWYLHKPLKCDFPQGALNTKKNILILVKSSVGNVEQRAALRTVWKDVNDTSIKYVFMLGYNRSHQYMIDDESRKYRDVIQENFIDSYLNNTLKTIMAYNWAIKYCRHSHVLLFLDDDFLVNITKMATYIRTVYKNQSSDLYMGFSAQHAPPYRNPKEKWYVSFQQYPFDEFPPYLAGGAYFVSIDVARRFYFAFPYVQYLGIDDVYLGIVAKKLSINPQHNELLNGKGNNTLAKECSHKASDLLKHICPLSRKRAAKKKVKLRRHAKPSAWVFITVFFTVFVLLAILTCCVTD